MIKLASLLTSILLFWPLLAHSTTYTVQQGTGNSSNCSLAASTTPINSIAGGATCLTPGDTLQIRAGVYNEGMRRIIPRGTASQPIVVQGETASTTILRPTSGDEVLHTQDDGSYTNTSYFEYVIFRQLTFDGSQIPSDRSPYPIRFDLGTRLVTIEDCIVIGNPRSNGISFGNDYNTSPTAIASQVTIRRTEVRDNGAYGIYLGTFGNVVEDSYIHNNGGYGIHMYDGATHAVNDNILRGNTVANNGFGTALPPQERGCGILLAHGTTTGSTAYNNLVLGHAEGVTGGCGIQIYTGNGFAKVYNNTIVNNHGACIYNGVSSVNSIIEGNVCFGNADDIVNEGSGASITSNNPNTRNPRFVDVPNGNYRLQTSTPRSPALDDAQNLTGLGIFTGDITGTVTRPATGPWDQGAYEMEAGGGGSLIPEKGTFFLDDTGTPNTTDCHAATGTVGSPSSAPFGTYATARVCMLAGSTLYFRTGTYPPLDSMSTPFTGGSPADGPTTLAAYPGETVTLQATGGSPVVFLHNSMTDHFIILQGLILDGLNINGTNGFAGYPGINDIRLDNVEIKNTYYEGVYLEGTANVELRNATKVHNSAVATVGVVGLNGTTNTTITGSEVYASGGPGISSYGGNTNLIIEKSTIRNTPSGKGILLGNGSNPDSGVRIANNLIYTNTYGIHLQAGVTGAGLYYNTLWNNSTACMLIDSGVTVSEAINNICWQVATLTNNAGSGMVLTTNQTTDPLFASVTPGDVNFLHLCGAVGAPVVGCTGKSPAIDTGTPIPSLTSDYASKARPDGVQVDKGAFEEVPVPVLPAQVGLAPVYRTTHFLTLLP